MTLLGFVITSLIVFAGMYLWYWYVHRDGVFNAAAGDAHTGGETFNERRRLINPRPRPEPARIPVTPQTMLAETGMIGEPDDDPEGAPLLPAIRRESENGVLNAHQDPALNTTTDEVERLSAGQDVSMPTGAAGALDTGATGTFANDTGNTNAARMDAADNAPLMHDDGPTAEELAVRIDLGPNAVNGVPGDVDTYNAVQNPRLMASAPRQDDFLTEAGTIGDITAAYNDQGQGPQANAQNTAAPAGIFPPPDQEFAPQPGAKYEQLSNQLPVADDTVMFKEPKDQQ